MLNLFTRRKRITKSLIAFFFGLLCLSLFWIPSQVSVAASKSLNYGYSVWPGYSGGYVATAKGFFKQQGLEAKEYIFQDATSAISAFLGQKLDILWATSGDMLQIVSKDPTVKIVFLVDYSNGSDGIVGRGIKTGADIKGKKVAREDLLFENTLLSAYLKKMGLTMKDVSLIDLSAADSGSAFASKKVDIAVTYEPWLTKSAKEGGGSVIFSTKDTNIIADVMMTRQKIITENKAELLSFIKAVDKGVKLVNAGDPEALAIVGKKLGVTAAEAKEQIAGVKVFDIAGNKEIGFNPNNPNNIFGNLKLTTQAGFDFKATKALVDYKTMYDDSLIKSL